MICYEIPKDSKNLQLLFQDWELPDNHGLGCEWPFECHSYPPIYLPPPTPVPTPPTPVPTPPTPEPGAKGENDVVVTNALGSSTPGCEETNNCFIPSTVTIHVGDSVTWDNFDSAAHTATAGSASDGPSGVWDSSLIMTGGSYSHIFDSEGVFPYFCMVHPWMLGTVIVGDVGTAPTPVPTPPTPVPTPPTPVPTPPTPELSTGCGEGTVLVDGVCQLEFLDIDPLQDAVLEWTAIGVIMFVVLGIPIIIIIVVVILIRRRKKTPKLPSADYGDVKKMPRKIKDYSIKPKKEDKKEEASMFCDNCGAAFKKPTAKFCGGCGAQRS
jgi:plastocyanin